MTHPTRRVIVTHGYPLQTAERLVAEGLYPAHLMWGADALVRQGWQVSLATALPQSRAARISMRIGNKLGGLNEQRMMLRPHDVVFAGSAPLVRGISMARYLGAWRRPIVAIFHGPVRGGRAAGPWVNGIDVALCLTSAAQRCLVAEHGRSERMTPVVPWGPDLDFVGYRDPEDGGFVLSSGKDNRDVATLLAALTHVNIPARVYAPRDETSAAATVTIISPAPGAAQLEYHEVIDDLRRATIVAIPVKKLDRLTGLTEINDALALGKPIVMTRTPYLDLDIEREGFGVFIQPGDVRGWRDALNALADDPARRMAMGKAARAFAEERWNYGRFCSALNDALQLVTPIDRHSAAMDRGQQPPAGP
jgi:hypothetical protein